MPKHRYAPLYRDYKIPTGKKTYIIGIAVDDVGGWGEKGPIRTDLRKRIASEIARVSSELVGKEEAYAFILKDKEATRRNFANLIEQTIDAADGADIVVVNASHGGKGGVCLESEKSPLTWPFVAPLDGALIPEKRQEFYSYVAPSETFQYDRYKKMFARHKGRVAIVDGACHSEPNGNEIPDRGIWLFASRRDEVSTNDKMPVVEGFPYSGAPYDQFLYGVCLRLELARVPEKREKRKAPVKAKSKVFNAIADLGSRAFSAYGQARRLLGVESPSPIAALEKIGNSLAGTEYESREYTHHPGIAYGPNFGK